MTKEEHIKYLSSLEKAFPDKDKRKHLCAPSAEGALYFGRGVDLYEYIELYKETLKVM